MFPNEGELFRGRSYLFLLDSNGTCILNNAAKSERVLSKESARVMNQMLSRVVSVGTAKRITIGEIVDVAGKTGTSGGSKDKLFIGYTPYFTAGIWCGYPDSSQAVPNYSKNHLNVWDAVMREIHEGLSIDEDEERFFSTLGLDYLPFCKDSGKLYTPICTKDVRGERLGYGYFIKGTYSNEMCDRHILCEYNLWQGDLYKEENRSEQKNFIALLKLPDRIFPKEIDVADSKYAYCKDTKESETEENKNHFFEEHRKKKQKRGLFWKRKQF